MPQLDKDDYAYPANSPSNLPKNPRTGLPDLKRFEPRMKLNAKQVVDSRPSDKLMKYSARSAGKQLLATDGPKNPRGQGVQRQNPAYKFAIQARLDRLKKQRRV
jgi:hypothetical protein